jgi:hypothetical protein
VASSLLADVLVLPTISPVFFLLSCSCPGWFFLWHCLPGGAIQNRSSLSYILVATVALSLAGEILYRSRLQDDCSTGGLGIFSWPMMCSITWQQHFCTPPPPPPQPQVLGFPFLLLEGWGAAAGSLSCYHVQAIMDHWRNTLLDDISTFLRPCP